MKAPHEPEVWEHPLFMTSLPSSADHPSMDMVEGLQALVYDNETPESLAEHFKQQGNDCVARGKRYYKDAVEYYTQALEQHSSDNHANSIYHSNRAQVEILRENFGNAIKDCEKALELDGCNIKACFRGAKACAALKKLDKVVEFCNLGLALDGENKPLKRELRKANKAKVEMIRKEKAKREKQARVENHELMMKELVIRRGITMGKATFQNQVARGDESKKSVYSNAARVCEDGYSLSWKVVFVYEEHRETDTIEAFHELTTLGDQLAAIFSTPSSWDTRGQYRADNLRVFYETNWTTPLDSPKNNKWKSRAKREVPLESTLLQALQDPDYVVPGWPVFYVVPNEFVHAFKKSD